MAPLIEALRLKSEGRGFDSRWVYWLYPSRLTVALGSIDPVTEMSTGNLSWGVMADKLILPPSCADGLEVLGSSTSWSREGLCRPV